MSKTSFSIVRKIFLWIGGVLLFLFVLVVVAILAIRTPWAQQFIIDKAVSFVAKKTQTRIELEKLFITFRGDVQLEGVYLEDQNQDTLVYIGELEAGVAFLPLINGNINISRVNWNGLVANVERYQDSTFNFTFIIDAFTGEPKPKEEKDGSGIPDMKFGPINFTDFDLHYRDEIIGLEADLRLANLTLETDDIDINTLRFEVDKLVLSNATGNATKWLANAPSEDDSTTSQLPFFFVNELSLDNIDLSYSAPADNIFAGIDLDHLNISKAEVDLENQVVDVKTLMLKNTVLLAHLPKGKTDTVTVSEPTPFAWPDWKIAAKNLELENTSVELKIGKPEETKGQFNPNDIRILGLNLSIEDVSLEDKRAALKFNQLSLSEKSGFELKELAFDLKADDHGVTIDGLNLTTPFNHITTKAKVKFTSLQQLISDPLQANFELDLAEADLSIEDAYFFAPQLRNDTLLRNISSDPIKLSGFISGNMKDITISDLRLSAFKSLRLSLSGTIKGLPDTNKIELNIPDLNLWLTRKDLAAFMDSAQTKSIPDSIDLNGTVSGSVKDLLAKLNVKTSVGNLRLDANAKNLLSNPSAKGKLELMDINVNKLASVPDLEPVSLTLDFEAAGNSIETLVADASIQFQKLTFKKYDYSNLRLTVAAADQKADLHIEHTDENLDFDLLVDALLDTVNPSADLTLNLTGIDFYELGLSPQHIKFGATVTASYAGPLDNFQSSLAMDNGVLVKGSEVYRLQPVNVSLNNATDSTKLHVSSEIVNGSVTANTSIDSIVGSLTHYLKRLTSTDSLRAGIMNDSLDVTAHFTVNNSRLLTEALLPKLTRLDSIQLDLEFHPSRNQLDLNLIAPKTVYANFTLDSLGLFATANGENLTGKLAFQRLDGGAVNINRTVVDFGLENKVASVNLSVADSVGGKLAAIGATIDLTTPNTLVSLTPEGLILNSEAWNIPTDNQISFMENGVTFRSMELTNAAQGVKFENLKSGTANGMKVSFDGFELSSLTSIVNANDSLLSGSLNGTVRLVNLDSKLGIDADISLDNLAALGIDLGQLKLLVNNKEKDRYNVDMTLKGDAIDLAVKGSLTAAEEMSLDMKADLNRLDVKLIEGFTAGQLKNTGGSLEAHSTVKGPVSDIRYSGSLVFNDAVVTVTQLNTRFTLPNYRVDVDNEGLVFKSFRVVDENGNKIQVDGKVDTRNLLDPVFDLHLVASNFQPLNSTRDDNDLFYGKAFLDADVKLTGSLSLPKVKARAKLLKGTDVTVIVPESEAAIEERKGLVSFSNMKDTLSTILDPENKGDDISIFTGMDLIGYVEIDRTTKFTIVIDERSGDRIEIEGEAKLNAEVTPNGIVTLSGNYEVESGFYRMNFYGLAKRKFELVSGSRIAWSGDPLAAELDLKAKYRLKTSASDLMADQLSQSDATTLTKYKQALPFEVMLNINGELLKPEISFGIDMPEGARQALDGNVYKRVKQLNSDGAELDKQVFSLIVLNRFMPQSFESDGSGSEALARSSVSKLLSGQLNAYSSKYLKGVEVNFDLNSYTDYESGTANDKTQLDVNIRKALFNDRVVVQVGGQVDIEGQNRSYGADDLIGDVSLEYLLTKEGQYRMKAFRKNEFQDLVQGQVVVMGLSVLFNKSFDEWSGLFKATEKKEETEIEEESETETEESETETEEAE